MAIAATAGLADLPRLTASFDLEQLLLVRFEFLLQLPGLGYELIVAIKQDDYLVVQGIVLVIAVAVVVLNFVVDFLFTVVDPRISLD